MGGSRPIATAVTALLAAVSPASAATTFGPASTVGVVEPTGGLAVAASEHGRMALAVGGDRKLFVATAGSSGGFGKSRAVDVGARLPRFLIGGTIAYLAIDDSGRMVTMVYSWNHRTEHCCNVAKAVFLGADARVRGKQALGPPDHGTLAIMRSHRSGTTAITAYGARKRLAMGTPSRRFSFVDIPPARDVLTYAGPGRFVAWLRSKDPSDAIVATRSVSGGWSPRRHLGPEPSAHSADFEHVAFGPDRLTLVAWTREFDDLDTDVIEAAWMRGSRVVRRQRIATYPRGSGNSQLSPAVDGAGRGTILWREGNRTLRAAHAEPGGRFSTPRTVWRAPAGQEIDYLHADGGPHDAIASWLAHPSELGAPPATVRAARVESGALRGGAVTLNDPADAGHPAGGPVVALDSGGRGAVVWVEGAGDGRVRIRTALVRR